MAASVSIEFEELLAEPQETLDVEVKEWLNLSSNEHRAALAKEIIALANHGGGFIVIGFKEQADGSFQPALPHPANLNAWSQDNIQAVVAKYVDPAIQCRVIHRERPGTSDRYPIVVVPGGSRSPVRAKAGSPDGSRLVPNRVYIRRAGPNSEEPRTTEEWDRVFERCVQARQSELLDAMRSIIAGVVPTNAPTEESRLQQLRAFEESAISRWTHLVSKLPANAEPRMPYGHYDVGIAIDGPFDPPSLSDLASTIRNAVRNHSGWPPFLTLNRTPFTPKPIDGTVEFWRGPDLDGSWEKPAHSDFWRVSPAGMMFTRRGLPEDGGLYDERPGTTFDITSATRRVGEAILEGFYIATALKAGDANLICHCSWTGLESRTLVSNGNPNRLLIEDRATAQNGYESIQTISIAALPATLPEIVFAILAPLYELFDFFQLPKRLVEEELADLRRHNF